MSDLISREEVLRTIITAGEVEPDLGYTHLHKVIENLPSAVCDDCIWHVCNHNKIDWDGEDGYISKRDALAEFRDGRDVYDIMESIEELPSVEPPYQYSKAYVEQIRGERDILQDMVDNMAKPKTETVLCALADRTCPFQGKEYAWCLTCPHISEEDRNLVKKAVSEPKTGEWVEDGSIEKCNQCKEPRDFPHWKYCPNCGSFNGGEEE